MGLQIMIFDAAHKRRIQEQVPFENVN